MKRYFLVSAGTDAQWGLDEYACGRSGIGGEEGTWHDAEDGVLSGNAIAAGVGRFDDRDLRSRSSRTAAPTSTTGSAPASATARCATSTATCARRRRRASSSRTASLWYTWVNKNGEDLSDLPEEISELYRRSLLVVQTQCDRDGGHRRRERLRHRVGPQRPLLLRLAARRRLRRRRHGPGRLPRHGAALHPVRPRLHLRRGLLPPQVRARRLRGVGVEPVGARREEAAARFRRTRRR